MRVNNGCGAGFHPFIQEADIVSVDGYDKVLIRPIHSQVTAEIGFDRKIVSGVGAAGDRAIPGVRNCDLW